MHAQHDLLQDVLGVSAVGDPAGDEPKQRFAKRPPEILDVRGRSGHWHPHGSPAEVAVPQQTYFASGSQHDA